MRPGLEGQALGVVGGPRWVARLALAAHVADHRDRPGRVVVALQAPGRDGRVVDGAVERQVQLGVPFEPIDAAAPLPPIRRSAWSKASEAALATRFQWPGGVSDLGPSAQNSARARVKSARGTTCGSIRLAGGRVDLVAVAVVGAQRVVALAGRADVDRHAVGRVELAAVADELDRRLLEAVIGGRAQHRWRARIDRCARRPRQAARTRSRGPSTGR